MDCCFFKKAQKRKEVDAQQTIQGYQENAQKPPFKLPVIIGFFHKQRDKQKQVGRPGEATHNVLKSLDI